jgi:DNA-binding YbaB/EbfC family protein
VNFADIMEMLRNPQAMQARVEELRAKTARVRATGSSGGGMVKVTLSGELEMLACEIAPEVVDPKDVVILQDLVRAAYNDASAKVKEAMQRELSEDLGGMPLPPGFPGSGLPGSY